jgi:hypothetical protein
LRKLKLTSFAAAAAAGLIINSRPVSAAPVDGTWAIQDLILEIYDCQNTVCGRVAWTKIPKGGNSIAGAP